MQVNTHPVSSEQVMAFLDDELPPADTKAVAQHLADCWECQVLLADLKGVSGALRSWTVEDPSENSHAPKLPVRRPWFAGWQPWAAAMALSIVVVSTGVLQLRTKEKSKATEGMLQLDNSVALKKGEGVARDVAKPSPMPSEAPAYARAQEAEPAAPSAGLYRSVIAPTAVGPMVVRTAALALTAAQYNPARDDIERIARFYGGYVADLSAVSMAGQPRSLRATLRIPSAQLDAALNELRRLGHVDSESQGGEDVTRQYVDVTARIANLHEAEARLTTILRERTGRLSDVLAVEEQIDRTRGQIEMAEAEQKTLTNQVTLATVQVSVAEVYRAQLDGSGTVATQIRNAGVHGVRLLGNAVLGLMLWFLIYLPILVLIGAVLFWPLRFAWKKMRT